MTKLSIPVPSLPKLPKISKKVLLVSLAVLLLLAIVSFAIVRNEQAKVAERDENARIAAVEKAEDDAVEKRIATIESELKTVQGQKKAICDYVKGLSTARATRNLTTVPTIANCQ